MKNKDSEIVKLLQAKEKLEKLEMSEDDIVPRKSTNTSIDENSLCDGEFSLVEKELRDIIHLL
ncbi:MAG TPA: hypothetical protein ENO30_06285 [Thermodesulfobium narugense]|nr:hypothetical protein [Thermodesulfobium narugense]